MHLDNLSKRLRDRGHFALAEEARKLEDEVVSLALALADEKARTVQLTAELAASKQDAARWAASQQEEIDDLKDKLSSIKLICEGT
jgi:polyhydroxyalkanoate synthesis regulator phasin